MLRELPRGFYIVLFFILLAANFFVYRFLFAPNGLHVSVLKTGKGDAVVLIQNPNGKTILVNTGPDASILRILGIQLPFWKQHIDAVVLTSAHVRFVGGLPEVMGRYRIKNLIRFGGEGSKSTEAAIATATSAAELPKGSTMNKEFRQTTAPYGTRISLSSSYIDILSPETITVSYGASILIVSSSTPSGAYTLN